MALIQAAATCDACSCHILKLAAHLNQITLGQCKLIHASASQGLTYLYVCLQGGKLSVLTAAVDPRVVALCLLDPVDNTVYAPLGPGYPSGIDALKVLGNKQVMPYKPCSWTA